jgi:hypothetical protein
MLEALKHTPYSEEVQQQIDHVVKLVFFEDEALINIDTRDLIEAATERPSAGPLGGLSKLLNMDNMDGLMKIMESF